MNHSEIKKKFATAKEPMNRRLVAPKPESAAQEATIIQQRLQTAKNKRLLGGSLAERLAGVHDKQSTTKVLSSVDIVMAIGLAISVIGVILGVIQSSIPTIGISALLLCGFGPKVFLALRSQTHHEGVADGLVIKLIDKEDVDRLDAMMEKLALNASQQTIDKLSDLKTLIARCVALMTQPNSLQPYSTDDQLFIRETVRRYLPDSINSYLRVPQKDRASVVIVDGKTALALLHDQLDMLTSQLQAKETRLSQLTGESLMQQQRFLAAKTRSHS